eukprot:727966-Prymnesium_polylepis.1
MRSMSLLWSVCRRPAGGRSFSEAPPPRWYSQRWRAAPRLTDDGAPKERLQLPPCGCVESSRTSPKTCATRTIPPGNAAAAPCSSKGR